MAFIHVEPNLINLAIEAAVIAGQEVQRIYKKGASGVAVTTKADHSPLTTADLSSHRIINKMLKTTDIPILSEEGKHLPIEERKHWRRLWVVDPLDGTKEFIDNIGEFTVNIALVENGRPVVGVIYVPDWNRLYVGLSNTPDDGAWRMDNVEEAPTFEQMQTTGAALPIKPYLDNYTVVISRYHINRETKAYMEYLEHRHGKVDFITVGSSLKFCMVAEGSASEYPRLGPSMEWDTAAGHAIAEGAGFPVLLLEHPGMMEYNKADLVNPWFKVTQPPLYAKRTNPYS